MKYQLPCVRRTRVVDMSPKAISVRLQRLEQLFRLGISLRRARLIGPVESDRDAAPPEPATSRG
jgi:hypothetical protein